MPMYSFHSFNYKLIDCKILLDHLPDLQKAQLYASKHMFFNLKKPKTLMFEMYVYPLNHIYFIENTIGYC